MSGYACPCCGDVSGREPPKHCAGCEAVDDIREAIRHLRQAIASNEDRDYSESDRYLNSARLRIEDAGWMTDMARQHERQLETP